MKAQTPKQVLLAMKWMLENIGWTQGTSYRDKDEKFLFINEAQKDPSQIHSMCLMGAWDLVETTSKVKKETLKVFDSVLPHGTMLEYNDTQGRTHQQVIALIQRAIRRA